MRPPGPQFSLRGEVVSHPVLGNYFSLGSDCYQHWRWNFSQQDYSLQTHPTRLNRSFFRLPVVNREGVSLQQTGVITQTPRFAVVNVVAAVSVVDEQAGTQLVESKSEKPLQAAAERAARSSDTMRLSGNSMCA